MLLAICNVNTRQYCAGVFANLEEAVAALAPAYTVIERPLKGWGDDPFATTATRVFRVEDTGEDSEVLEKTYPDFAGRISSDCNCFDLYEYTDKFPGYLPFNED